MFMTGVLCTVCGARVYFVYRITPPPVYQDPTCTENFLYRYTSLISAASWYTGGAMFYKFISLLVDFIMKNDIFTPKCPKLGNI